MSICTADGREVVFIHIPKTAGMSVWSVVGRPVGVNANTTHATAAQWMAVLGDARYAAAFSFAVIRNPYDRFLAAWHYLTSQTPEHRYWEADGAEREWVASLGATVDQFAENMPASALTDFRGCTHFVAQVEFLTVSGECAVSQAVRFEHLTEDWRAMAERYGLPSDLPRINKTPGKRPKLTDATKARIADLYAADFAFLREVYQP